MLYNPANVCTEQLGMWNSPTHPSLMAVGIVATHLVVSPAFVSSQHSASSEAAGSQRLEVWQEEDLARPQRDK